MRSRRRGPGFQHGSKHLLSACVCTLNAASFISDLTGLPEGVKHGLAKAHQSGAVILHIRRRGPAYWRAASTGVVSAEHKATGCFVLSTKFKFDGTNLKRCFSDLFLAQGVTMTIANNANPDPPVRHRTQDQPQRHRGDLFLPLRGVPRPIAEPPPG
jgi:hypothetical protein